MKIGATCKRLCFDQETRCLVFVSKDRVNWKLTLDKLKSFHTFAERDPFKGFTTFLSRVVREISKFLPKIF